MKPTVGASKRSKRMSFGQTLDQLEFWIEKGVLVPRPEFRAAPGMSERALLDRGNLVKVTVDESGVWVKWHAFGANWASLYFAKEWIGTFRGPYTLQYYISGWFTETIADAAQARDRIDHLIGKSDLHLSSRIYMRPFDPKGRVLPENLRRALEAGQAPEETSIDCSIDDDTGRVKVERIGTNSAIARLWGMSPVTTPCLSGTSYDKAVSHAYADVLRTGRPHYDHIYAAMMGPDGDISWIPYQRLVTRHPASRGSQQLVSVVSEVTPVEIAVV
jgi:hypothetical protein